LHHYHAESVGGHTPKPQLSPPTRSGAADCAQTTQAGEAGETLDAEEAMTLANSELHAIRRKRRARKR